MLEFYAPWCGHCKNLIPTWEELATKLKNEGAKIKIAKFDASIEEAIPIATKLGLRGYPTLKVFDANKKTSAEYNGGSRTLEELHSFATSGYHNAEQVPFAAQPDWYDPVVRILTKMAADGQDIYYNKLEAGILTFVTGLIAGVGVAVLLFLSAPQQPPAKDKRPAKK